MVRPIPTCLVLAHCCPGHVRCHVRNGESRHSIPGGSVGQPTEPCLSEWIRIRLREANKRSHSRASRASALNRQVQASLVFRRRAFLAKQKRPVDLLNVDAATARKETRQCAQAQCQLCPHQRTPSGCLGMSEKCHFRTHAPQQTASRRRRRETSVRSARPTQDSFCSPTRPDFLRPAVVEPIACRNSSASSPPSDRR